MTNPDPTATPNLKDFYYATFFEVECPSCAESEVFSSKTEAQEWARSHKNNHRYSRRFNDFRSMSEDLLRQIGGVS